MSDIASLIDGSAPSGAASHQTLLDQMHVALDGRRPALLDDSLYGQLVGLKSFRHLVRHQYGVDLDPDKTEAKRTLMNAALGPTRPPFAASKPLSAADAGRGRWHMMST